MTLKESQILMYDHSEVKVQLLKLYLEKYLNILSNSRYVGDVYIYDLFCGEGIYKEGGKGSPIVILETLNEIHNSNKEKARKAESFHCLFNDIDKSKISKLSQAISEKNIHNPELGNLKIISEDYRKLLPQVLNQISKFSNQKAFVFIDPYGYKEIRVADIRTLLSSRKSEILLFMPTQFMFRFEEKGTPECLQFFIKELIPDSEWPKSSTGIDFIEKLKNAFRKVFKNEYFVDTFIITRNTNQFFCLFFFTSHIYGFEKMLESKWQIDEEEGRGWNQVSNYSLFTDVEKSANVYILEKELTKYLKSDWHTNGELYEYTLHSGYLPKHAIGILKNWQNAGRLEMKMNNGVKLRKGSFYIRYDNYKMFPNKLKIKLK